MYGISWHPSKPCLLSCGWDSQLLLHHVATDNPNAGIMDIFAYAVTIIFLLSACRDSSGYGN